MAVTEYGDISPRTAAHASKDLLKRALPYLVFEKFGQPKPLKKKNSKTITFRRYEALDPTPAALTEGVAPTAKQLTKTDVPATLSQYGDLVEITDVVEDTHEDPVLSEATDILGEQAGQLIEITRFNVLKACSNAEFANGSARGDVNTKLTKALQRKCLRTLKRANAKKITQVVRSTAKFNTENVAPSYIGIIHPDVENDVRDMAGFIDVKDYGSLSPWENEIGSVEGVRYLSSTIIEPWADAGGTKGTMISTGGTNADIYGVLYIARDAYGLVPLKGANSLAPKVLNPNVPRGGDPLGQKGSAGWKTYNTTVILNDDFMVRAEVAVEE